MKKIILTLSMLLLINANSYAEDTSSDDTDSVMSKFDEIESMLAGKHSLLNLGQARKTLNDIQNQYCSDDNFDDTLCGIRDAIDQKITDIFQAQLESIEKRKRERGVNY
ncbi:MAG: hypothetical protein Q8L85_09545 [Alphaproteobacteria bacterium]|nr:hypothetical protein [Alphaproteobacteria bacterium]